MWRSSGLSGGAGKLYYRRAIVARGRWGRPLARHGAVILFVDRRTGWLRSGLALSDRALRLICTSSPIAGPTAWTRDWLPSPRLRQSGGVASPPGTAPPPLPVAP